MRCMHCSDLLKDLHPVCLLYDMYVCMCMHVEGVQCGGGESIPHLYMLQDMQDLCSVTLGTWSGV